MFCLIFVSRGYGISNLWYQEVIVSRSYGVSRVKYQEVMVYQEIIVYKTFGI